MRPAFRRGWVGEGKAESSPWRGPAGKARHTGATIALWERKGETLGVPAYQTNGGGQPPAAATRHKGGTLAARDADGCPARGLVGQRASGKERGKSASGSAQKRRSLIRVYAVSVRHSGSRSIMPFA
jgi:hypothetical protein